MAVPGQTSPLGLRLTAIILMIGGLLIGVGLPVLFAVMKIRTVEIARGVDLMMVLLPLIGVMDLVLARMMWRRADVSDPQPRGPIA
jgi:hypothetical protein